MSSTLLIASKEIVSRRNQDGSVVLMRLDETSVFYKITGVAALCWGEFAVARNPEWVSRHYPAEAAQQWVPELLRHKLLQQVDGVPSEEPMIPASEIERRSLEQGAGGIQEFNLEQIESEVLGDNIYLDVFAGSDFRLKQDIQPLEGSLSKVASLEGVRFSWKPEQSSAHTSTGPQVGLIAQQVAECMPELTRRDLETGYLAVNYSKLTAFLVEAIKELKAKAEAQEQRIADLEKTSGHRSGARDLHQT
jgi:Chaperone of endosialidase